RQNLVRRIIEGNRNLELLYALVKYDFDNITGFDQPRHSLVRDCLRGMYEGLRGQGQLTCSKNWRDLLRHLSHCDYAEIKAEAFALSVLYGDPDAIKSLMDLAGDTKAPRAKRESAIQMLLEARAPGMNRLVDELLTDTELRSPAIRALAV